MGKIGGRILSQQGGFQVSREGLERGAKGNQQGEIKKARGMHHVYCNLCPCV
jgi:hypothetical protein